MIAYGKWIELREELEEAVENGRCSGFDKQENTFQGGCFYAYNRVLAMMNELDCEESAND